ncbi:MAG: hypothetical protein LBK63_09310 [Treponema sp.]|jgi:hypothetical protein|nr:hypothetical protein [Treponema sp.]
MKKLLACLPVLCCLFAGCELYEYGQLGGADVTIDYYPRKPGESATAFETLMEDLSGVWYSHYAGIGRLDGYRIGRWADFEELVIKSGKLALIPNIAEDPVNNAETKNGGKPAPGDYFVLYDSSVYGQQEDGGASASGWQHNFGFCGIVRAVNLFYDIPERGAVIIEYLEGCAPQWDKDIKDGQLPFFGIYYRFLGPDIVQMANAVDLEALYKGKKYYTEKATLPEAVESNTVENEAEYIAWGVVIPQDREP